MDLWSFQLMESVASIGSVLLAMPEPDAMKLSRSHAPFWSERIFLLSKFWMAE